MSLKKIDVFHKKGVCKIMKIKTTYIGRTCTDKELFWRANQALEIEAQQMRADGRQVKAARKREFWGARDSVELISEEYFRRKQKLFAKVVLYAEDDTRRSLTCALGTFSR